ncbi:hypothetical protein GRI89_02425 [Altererythrobacter salegens]|uniref:histidine kinase n=1 Tax=Croceibacterium salegens TaxID=1737568 RepID=A0A6I4SVR0_9SPHN|nr:histidine kinase [Croceibacterium salegens]MXO58402.1 hypothetical protein [Croceibacterium salegens]
MDPDQPVRSHFAGYALLFGYIALSAGLFALAWRSWWWDYQLSWPAHAVDVAVFLAAVYFTEGAADDFTSPFLAFFAYLMLASTFRWSWRVTALTGLTATVLYMLVGLGMQALHIEMDIYRFGRRVIYMLVLAMVLIWLGDRRFTLIAERFVEPPGATDDRLPPLDEALRFAMAQIGARSGAIAWADDEEPQIELRVVGLDRPRSILGPGELPGEMPFPASARLFDSKRRRVLRSTGDGNFAASRNQPDEPLAAFCGISSGLALPFEGVTGRGTLLLAGIPGASVDHIALGEPIAREVGAGFDRQSTVTLVREGAVTRMRDAVARDLHDTIAQSLAGAALRLEGLRKWIASGGDPEPEIQAIKAALKTEQVQVRALIARLRRGEAVIPDASAASSFGKLLRELSSYWGIEAVLQAESRTTAIPGWQMHDLRQIVREGVVNAVRHGAATRVEISLAERAGMLELVISDNGSGFSVINQGTRPRSIGERVDQLGGSLVVESGIRGTRLHIVLRADGA